MGYLVGVAYIRNKDKDTGLVYKDTGLLEKVEFLENFLEIWWGDLRLGGPGAYTGSTVPFTFGTRYAIAIYMPNKNEKKSIKSEKNT